jgi:cytochrome c-type biogenesis protein CcmH
MLWLIFVLMSLLAIGFVVAPLLRRPSAGPAPLRADYDIAVYKDQLRDIERDRARGVLDTEQAAAARLEVERRLLAASAALETSAPGTASPHAAPWPFAFAIALILVSGAGLVYLQNGAPWFFGSPDVTQAGAPQSELSDLLAELERSLTVTPTDRRGWVLLARGYVRQGRMTEATAAQDRALALTSDDREAGEIAAGFGQVVVEESQGAVTPEARAAFVEALRRNPAQHQARYFIGLAKLQDGDGHAALEDWRALLADSPAEASWRAGLAQQIARLEAELSAPTDPAARQALIESMVAGLAARLEQARASGGGTAQDWAQLGRSYRVLTRAAEARDAYAEAIKRAPDDIDLLRDYAASVGDADGKTSSAYGAALRQLRDRLPPDSAERGAIEERLKGLSLPTK